VSGHIQRAIGRSRTCGTVSVENWWAMTGGSDEAYPPVEDDGRAPDFLVSCVEADAAWADWIGWQLLAAGFEPEVLAWAPPGSLRAGRLDDAVRAARRTLVVLSPDAVDSRGQLAAQWAAAFAADPGGSERQLIPVIVRACAPEGLLGARVPISLADLDEQEAREALLAGIEAAVEGRVRPRSEPRFPGPGGSWGARSAPGFPGFRLPEELTDFLGRVADAYRDRFPGARITRAVSADGLRYLEVRAEVDGRRRRWPVGVCPGALDDAALDRYVEQVHAPYERHERWGESDLVHDQTLADDLLPNRARRAGVRVRSIHAVEQGWDPARYLARQRARLAADREYPPDLYVASRAAARCGCGRSRPVVRSPSSPITPAG
jgi:hypothetical protein